MSQEYVVAVVGATGVVGKEMISTLESRDFPIKELRLLASERSAGQMISFRGDAIEVQALNDQSFEGVDYALFSAGGSISKQYCPIAVKSGAICIDNSSHFRMDADVPLVVPEVNPQALENHNGIIANPNCSTAQMVVVLEPIRQQYGIKRVVVSTYQSVSGAGKDALDELENHSRANLSGKEMEPEKFSKPIPFNVIPHIDVFQDNGYTKEEMKMVLETKKILGEDIPVTATAVRVPVFISHAEAINIQTEKPVDIQECRELLDAAAGVQVQDDTSKNEYPTPRSVSGEDDVFVGRIRKDISVDNGIELWCVGDNLRKGAALNAVQIAETLVSLVNT